MDGYHKSVLINEILEFLDVQKDSWYLDCTLGDGGYSLEILKKGGNIIGIDADPQALSRSRKRFEDEGIDEGRFILKNGNFSQIDELVGKDQEIKGIILDLGVSTLQLKDPKRGFSFLNSGPIDMRMNPELSVRAVDLLNALNKGELMELFRNYGEESQSKQIAQAIVDARPIETTVKLAEIVEKAVGGRYSKIHPATKVFQALRIAVNDELESLKIVLPKALELIMPGGRIIVVSFHSLEDAIVKHTFKDWENTNRGEIMTDKPIIPTDREIGENISSRSSKLRVFQKEK
jgi:16S rRNA (cytosine1402-N4)-methyltransferase